MQDVTSKPWAHILEQAIKDAVKQNAQKMMVAYITNDGVRVAACYKSTEDLAKMAVGVLKSVREHVEEGK